MLPYRDSRFTIWALAVFFVIAVLYALFEARGIILGPTITLSTAISEVHEQFVMIKGEAQRIASLSMNGKQVQVTKEGAFAESYLLALGYNRIVLEAKDQYGRSTEHIIELIYNPSSAKASEGEPSTTATTTSATSPAPLAQ